MPARRPRRSDPAAPHDDGPAVLDHASADGLRPNGTGADRPRRSRRRLWIVCGQLALLVAFVGAWQGLAQAKVIDVFFFGEPSGVWRQLSTWVQSGTAEGPLWMQAWVTFQETLIGFGIGVALGVTFGILLGRIQVLADLLSVYIGAANSIPRIVLGSVFVIWFGLGMTSKVALVVVLVFFNVFFNAFQGAREVDHGLVANARQLGAGRIAVLLQVILPAAFSWIIASLRTAFGYAVTGAVVGELLGAQQGLGTLIAQAQGDFNPDGVYAGLLVTTTLALAAEGAITLVERRLLRWRPQRPQSP